MFKNIILNDALRQKLDMFVYFMMILHQLHLNLWSNFEVGEGYRFATPTTLSWSRAMGDERKYLKYIFETCLFHPIQ